MVKFMIQFNGKQLTLPINPEEIEVSTSNSNDDIKIIGVGNTVRKGDTSLKTVKIESYFPSSHDIHYTGVLPKTCVEFIRTIQNTENKKNNVAKIITTGLPINLSMFFVIEDFSITHKHAEEDDIYYNLEIKEYIPYGVKTVKNALSGLAAARAESPKKVSPPPAPKQENVVQTKTYTVKSGDCLWNISKKLVGDGSRWRELYNLNPDVIGGNPNLIHPGQVLTLPTGW